MATNKVTFTLDQPTVTRLQDAAALLALPKSHVVREAIRQFYEGIGRLSERERFEYAAHLRRGLPRIPARGAREVARELKALRQARRSGGRRSMGSTRL